MKFRSISSIFRMIWWNKEFLCVSNNTRDFLGNFAEFSSALREDHETASATYEYKIQQLNDDLSELRNVTEKYKDMERNLAAKSEALAARDEQIEKQNQVKSNLFLIKKIAENWSSCRSSKIYVRMVNKRLAMLLSRPSMKIARWRIFLEISENFLTLFIAPWRIRGTVPRDRTSTTRHRWI